MLITLISLIINFNLQSQCDSSQLKGSVYVDTNFNGIYDAEEEGKAGVFVRVLNSNELIIAQSITDTNGDYVILGLNDNQEYLVRFDVPDDFNVSAAGIDNGTDIQFITSPTCEVSMGLVGRQSDCYNSTEIIISCFANAITSDNPDQETVIGITHKFNAASKAKVYATNKETGSVWGMAYNPDKQEIYTSAFVKQHASLTPFGHDAIFKTTLGNTPQTSLLVKLSELGLEVGTLNETISTNCAYGKQVGKIGLGGISFDEDNSHLYIANLFNNSIVRINVNNPQPQTTKVYPVPNPSCTFNDFRLFAVKHYNGAVYAGVTCTGETSKNEDDTYFHIYKLNPESGNYSLEFSSDFTKGIWSDINNDKEAQSHWFTDIDFTDDANMILGISDRKGHNFCKGTISRVDAQSGDILVLEYINNQWVLENNGSTSALIGSGVGNGQGPGGGEFFGYDFFPVDETIHPEIALGSIVVVPNTGEVVTTVFDPIFNSYSGGLHRYSTSNGKKIAAKELYNSNIDIYFGKATGFGDMTARCGNLSSEVGNLVWLDNNCDGIQNAGEPGLGNIPLEIYNSSCELVGTTVTNDKGQYAFNKSNVDSNGDGILDGLTKNEQYFITISQDKYDASAHAFVYNNIYYYPTVDASIVNQNSDLRVSNELCIANTLNSTPVVSVNTISGNNPSYDIGLKEASDFDLALSKEFISDPNFKIYDIVEFGIKVYNQGGKIATEFTLVDYMTPAFTFDPALNPGWTLENGKVKKTVTDDLAPTEEHTEILKLKFVGSTNIAHFINYAEIAAAKDNTGEVAFDIDSTPDDIPNNDKGGEVDTYTDNLITDDGTNDEDDHDPAKLNVLDLALKNVVRDARLYDEGEHIIFDMTIYNQGNVPVSSFEVTNKFSECLSFEQSKNLKWEPTIPGFAKTTINETLYPGEKKFISLRLRLDSNCEYNDVLDIAEISKMVSGIPGITIDIDSDPDDFMFNDKGGNPYDLTDNLITDDGTIDEDDHDPAVIGVRKIDLALMKTTERELYGHGDRVTFDIKIYNQGDITVGTVMLVDYMPDNTTLDDLSWQVDPSDQSGRTVYKTISFENGFGPADEHTEQITLFIEQSAPSGIFIINEAEIAQVFDVMGVDISSNDIDSYADSMNGNDMGGQFATATDNNIFDNGQMDEDDHDPSGFFIASITTPSACNCRDNATDPYNGQFYDEIVITSISGQTWTIDESNNIYDPSSTVNNLIPLNGYVLIEQLLGDNISEYTFTGVYQDGDRYNIRFTNGNGSFLQSNGGGPSCTYNRPVITSPSGLSAVCSGSVHEYTVSNLLDCTSYSWDLPDGGGTILGSSTSQNVLVEWDNAVGGPYRLGLTPNCDFKCLAPVVESVSIGNGGTAMSCLGQVNVSLNADCTTYVDSDVFLTSAIPFGTVYQLMLINDHGQIVPNNYLTEDYLWESLTAKVIDPCTGNSCWSTLTVEDKMGPQIQCEDISMPCYLMHSYEPLVLDNCTDATYSLIGETVQPLNCDPDYIKEVTRIYVATDGYGNQSAPCEQTIRLERLNYNNIVPPLDYLLSDGTNLTCIDSIYNEDNMPDVKVTGAPTLNGYPIFPLQDLYCNVAIVYEDFLVSDFGCVRKIMRTWRIYEDWCTIGEFWTYTQAIEIVDTENPVIECPEDITVSSGGGINCEKTFTLALPVISDNCTSTDFIIDISYDGGFFPNVKGPQVITLPAGTSDVIFNVYDVCENLSSCDLTVVVLDETAPVAVCDENTVVSLRSDGTAKAFADTFDDGSYDDCSLFNTLVKRLGGQCDCKQPKFDDMHYLGERDGRFYYLSKFQTHGSKAFLYSEAYGGMLLRLESEGEAEWVYDRTRSFITSSYYIGLSDASHEGRFTWSNHEDPTIDLWGFNQPYNDGDHVVTNSDGEWIVVDGNDVETYYVLEVSDPCGYSDEVHFCCEDVKQEQMVIFRAIDYFGKVNECMVMVEVQDKVAPKIQCPSDFQLSCEDDLNLEDLSQFGIATASDQCSFEIREELIDERNSCGFGDLIRRFYAEDNNGFSTCDQRLIFSQDNKFDNNTIIWPLDFTTDLGCNSGDLHPDSLDFEFSRPQYEFNRCSQVAVTFADKTYDFSGTNSSDACLKILRSWTVIDWCQMEDPDYLPAYHEQVIKVNNTVGPEIRGGCDSLIINTFECEFEDVVFSAIAQDDCTPDSELNGRLLIDINSDGNGVFDIEDNVYSNVVSFDGQLPLGNHFALISFSDQCGNTTTCTKIIQINNIKGPTAACIDGISVALEPMDLDGDGEFDTEMACIRPFMLDASSTHECDIDFVLSFSADPSDTIRCFDCDDLGENLVQLWVIDAFGNTDFCETTVEVQDNNMQDFCPRFDLALIKTLDTVATPGPFMQGSDLSFNIEVINQGNISAFNIELIDYIPEGLLLNDGDWTDNGDGTAEYTSGIGFLEDSTSTVVSIDFIVSEDFMGFTLTNYAEILAADDDDNPNNEAPVDADSTPDNINDDVVGGDNEVNNAGNDEDDHDLETVDVEQIFDLSLSKDIGQGFAGPFSQGSVVQFDITITNEGTLDAYNVQVVDRVPAGLTLNDASWSLIGNRATLVNPIPFIARGTSEIVTITFLIESDFMDTDITNSAEIIDPDNEFPQDDEDSTPDNDDENEDDQDEETIQVEQVFDLALTKVIDTDNTPSPINVGDDVSFIITVYNQGSLDAFDIRVMDYIPVGFTFDDTKNPDFSSGGSDAQASIPFVGIDDFIELELVLTLEDMLPSPSLINNAEITAASNLLGMTDQDDDLANVNNGSTNELATDNDIDDERPSAPGTMDNPDDEDDYDPAQVDVFCPPTALCQTDLIFELNSDGELDILIDDIDDGSSDNCNQTLNYTLSQSSFDCTDLGDLTITLTVSVDSGLIDDCEADITIVDNISPVADCNDIIVAVDTNGELTIVPSQINDMSSDACNNLALELDVTEFDCDDLFQSNPVVLTVTDGSGNSDTCDANVEVIDLFNPMVMCNNTVLVDLGPDGMETVMVSQYIQSSSDNCGIDNMSATQTEFDCEDVDDSPIFVSVTVMDASGNSAQCSSLVIIEDNTAPTCTLALQGIDIVAETIIELTELEYVGADNCTGTLDIETSIDPVMFDCEDVGSVEVVTVTVTDEQGNSSTCSTSVDVIDDSTPICVADDITVSLDASGMASITPADIDGGSTAGCDTNPNLIIDISEFDCDDIGPNLVTLTVTGDNGMFSSCTAFVTIVDDMNPTVTCVPDFTISLTSDMVLITTGAIIMTSDDNCGISSSSIDMSLFDCDDDGQTFEVTATVTDPSGNTATCSTNVTVDDDSAPTCTLISDITVAPNQVLTIEDLVNNINTFYEDNCSDAASSIVIDPTSFDCNSIGVNIVTVTVTDDSGNSATCTSSVTVSDDQPPICIAQDISVNLNAMGVVNITAGQIDNGSTAGCDLDPLLEIDPSSFDCGDVGVNVVTLTVTGDNGMSSSCDANVTVRDLRNPTVTCMDDFIVSLDSDMVIIEVGDIIMSSNDNCGIVSSVIDMTMFDCDDDGQTFTITATVTDPSGNTATCSTDVTIDDDAAPTCTLISDITIAPNSIIDIEDLVTDINTFYMDNCNDVAASIDIDTTVFDCTMLGLHVVTVTVTDDSGNSATCTSNVTIEDIPEPVCIPMDITISLDVEGNYTLTPEEVDGGSFGGCAEPIELSIVPTFIGCNDVDLSPIQVVLTVTDQNDATSSCIAEVTVLDDIPPVISCITDITLDLDSNGEVVLVASDVVTMSDDGCGIDSEVLDISLFDCTNKNTVTIVTATVTDDNGNTSQCMVNVTVEDNMAPSCTIVPGLSFPPNVIIPIGTVRESFTDNCASASSMSSLSPNMFTCNELGVQIITLTVNDDCGNSGSCTGEITIVDNSIPECVSMDITVSLDGNGNYNLMPEEVDGGSTVACGSGLELEVDPNNFDCGNLGVNVVTLTVTASGGGSDSCTANVTVIDDTDPIIVCPANSSFPCETDISNLSIFGTPVVTDNCDMNIPVIESDTIDVNTCNVGTIQRVFTVTDDSGNSASCIQVLTIEGPSNPLVEADITWPTSPFDAGQCIANPDSIDSGMPIVDTSGLDCFNITITFVDVITGDAACDGVIERTWTVTDSCQAPGGVFTFLQIINVDDTTGPDIDGPSDMVIILPPGNTTCDTFLNLPATVMDCTGGFTAGNDSPFADDNSIPDASGTYPVGFTTINITATDACGNDSIYTYTVNVVDTTAFIFDCAKIIDNIQMATLNVVINISQAQAVIDVGECMGGTYVVSFSNMVNNQDTIIATCSDVGLGSYTIYLWSGGLVIDSCTNLLQIVDGGGFCSSPIAFGNIIGEISTEDKRMVDDVLVNLIGSPFEPQLTTLHGEYAFPEMAFGGSYIIQPFKNQDYLNGVSTLDMIEMQKHILGAKEINSPYKLIAADIDNSGTISGSDLLELRKLILGVNKEFANNTSWRMIDKSFKFLDPKDPFAAVIPENYEIDEFTQSMIVDFVAVKVGDINNSAIANAKDFALNRRSGSTFYYELEEEEVNASELIEVTFKSIELKQLEGIQHSLLIDPEYASIVEIKPLDASVSNNNFNIVNKEAGIINFSWNGQLDDLTSDALFSLVLKVKKQAWISDMVSIEENGILPEAYFKDEYPSTIDIDFKAAKSEMKAISLYQNIPNPWTESTRIKFYMPTSQEYNINIYDVNGRLIYKVADIAREGVNAVEVRNEIFENGGLHYYELISAKTRLINKMLFVK